MDNIRTWIKQARSQKLTNQEIAKMLIGVGWTQGQIADLLAEPVGTVETINKPERQAENNQPPSISYTITPEEHNQRSRSVIYKTIPAIISILAWPILQAWLEVGWGVVIGFIVFGILIGIFLFYKQRHESKKSVDIKMDNSGLYINENGKANHYPWNHFTKVMTNTLYAQINSRGAESAQVIEAAERLREAHGQVFLLFFDKQFKSNVWKQHLTLYAEPDNWQAVERVLYNYLPYPDEKLALDKIKKESKIVWIISIIFLVIVIAFVIFFTWD
ncbi:MAG: hypothetical protein WCV50_06085 [Patescibacteria group bacterium]|jgi:hypothetical protein